MFRDTETRYNITRVLAPNGIVVRNYASVGYTYGQGDHLRELRSDDVLGSHFNYAYLYQCFQSTFMGGQYTFAFMSDACDPPQEPWPVATGPVRDGRTKYYTPDVHRGSIALPAHMISPHPVRRRSQPVCLPPPPPTDPVTVPAIAPPPNPPPPRFLSWFSGVGGPLGGRATTDPVTKPAIAPPVVDPDPGPLAPVVPLPILPPSQYGAWKERVGPESPRVAYPAYNGQAMCCPVNVPDRQLPAVPSYLQLQAMNAQIRLGHGVVSPWEHGPSSLVAFMWSR